MTHSFFSLYDLARAFVLLALLHSTAIEARDLRLATTTSTDNSGLLRAILPQFEKAKGIKVQVVSVGTGKALKLGRKRRCRPAFWSMTARPKRPSSPPATAANGTT
jgi:ABC-type tungstate transport system permease subunit